MSHPLVLQLRFSRSEFRRAIEGLTDADARTRHAPMNSISWNIGHLAWQEQRYWLFRGQNRLLLPRVDELFANGAPASTPPLHEVWETWQAITEAADPWLDTLTTEQLQTLHPFTAKDQTIQRSFGSMLQRVIYHYWYHTGENMAIRQLLGHSNLPDFVGNIDEEAPYQRE